MGVEDRACHGDGHGECFDEDDSDSDNGQRQWPVSMAVMKEGRQWSIGGQL